jgi:hypothetical protein
VLTVSQVRASLLPHVAMCLLAACLDGSAEPIVRVPDAATDAARRDVATSPARFALYYDNLEPSDDAPAINFIVKVHNLTGGDVALRRLAVRYYFQNELAQPWETSIFYTGTCCGNERSQFDDQVQVTVSPVAAGPAADSFLELTFAEGAGTLSAGDAVQVELSFHAAGYARRVAQATDFSFLPRATGTQSEWDRCPGTCDKFVNDKLTLYDDGVLVLGASP